MSSKCKRRSASVAVLALSAFAGLFAGSCGDENLKAVRGKIDVPVRQLNLGEVPVLNTKVELVDVRNVGRAPLNMEGAFIKEEGTPFTVERAPKEIASSDTHKVPVSFKPPKQETYTATLAIPSDDENEKLVEVKLEGRGSTVARMVADKTLDFLLVCEGTGDIKRVKIQSQGTADLILEEVKLKEGTAPEFQFVSSTKTPAQVAKGKELLISIRYTPTEKSPDQSTGTLVVTGTDPENRTVEIPLVGRVNRAPIAEIKEPPNGAPGATLELDGTDSRDPDGNTPLLFAWSVKASPVGSKGKPTPVDTPKTNFTLDLPGQYTLQLKVKDSLGCFGKPAFKDILAKPAQQLLVELVWNNHDTDMDLHMVPDGETFFGARDCYYSEANRTPDWGILGDPSDDPSLDRDDLTGFGPEIIGYKSPARGKYRVMAHFYADHGSKSPATEVTLRVYEFGVVKSELKKTLTKAGQKWTAVTIDWPSGAVSPVDTME